MDQLGITEEFLISSTVHSHSADFESVLEALATKATKGRLHRMESLLFELSRVGTLKVALHLAGRGQEIFTITNLVYDQFVFGIHDLRMAAMKHQP